MAAAVQLAVGGHRGSEPAADTVGNLSRQDGKSSNGTWTARVADVFNAAAGGTDGTVTCGGWSILVTPVHFARTAFAPTASIASTNPVSGTFKFGGSITYTVTLTNNGTANPGDTTGHEFVDVLPVGLAWVSATATTGTAITTGNTVNGDGAFAPLGGSTTITINATVNAGTQGTSISNQGTVNYDSNNDGSNDATLILRRRVQGDLQPRGLPCQFSCDMWTCERLLAVYPINNFGLEKRPRRREDGARTLLQPHAATLLVACRLRYAACLYCRSAQPCKAREAQQAHHYDHRPLGECGQRGSSCSGGTTAAACGDVAII